MRDKDIFRRPYSKKYLERTPWPEEIDGNACANLWQAVLLQGMKDYQKGYPDARHWVTTADFINVCEYAGFNPDSVKKALIFRKWCRGSVILSKTGKKN